MSSSLDFQAAMALDDRFRRKMQSYHDEGIETAGALNVYPGSDVASYVVTSSDTFVLNSAATITGSQTVTLTAGSYSIRMPNDQYIEVASGSLVLSTVGSLANDTLVNVSSGTLVLASESPVLGSSISITSGKIKLQTVSSVAAKGFTVVNLVIEGDAYEDSSVTMAGDAYADNVHVNNAITMGGKDIIKMIDVIVDTDIKSSNTAIIVVRSLATSSVLITHTGSTTYTLAAQDTKVFIQTSAGSFAPLTV